VDPREQDTRERLDVLESALEGGANPEKLFSLAASGLVAIDFRATDAMIGIPEVAPELVDALRALTCRALVKAAEGGHVKAALALGERTWEQRDHRFAAHAVRALERVADLDGSGRAYHLLAMFHFHGLGPLESKSASVALHEKAAARGDAESMFELYAMLAQGLGTDADVPRAIEWCKRAAEAGNARAMYNLGAFHAVGRDVPQDDALSVHWYRSAADAGHGRAAATLGVMFASGDGAHRDPARARQYLDRADELGFDWRPLARALGVDEQLEDLPEPEATSTPDAEPATAPAWSGLPAKVTRPPRAKATRRASASSAKKAASVSAAKTRAPARSAKKKAAAKSPKKPPAKSANKAATTRPAKKKAPAKSAKTTAATRTPKKKAPAKSGKKRAPAKLASKKMAAKSARTKPKRAARTNKR
jgi:hypothetical protein